VTITLPALPTRLPRALHVTNPSNATPGAGRAHVAAHCARRHTPEAVIDTAQLVASELLTNGVLHAPGPLSLRVTARRSGTVIIRVTDHNPTLPHIPPPDEDEHGMGWLLVLQLAYVHTVRRRRGKCIVAVITNGAAR
jgi:anti-sigma regulatory factor (Ser/Thr protein kinase)